MKPDTWMPLYVGAYMADTSDLTTEQHGAYFLLLMAMWRRGGALPNDDERLASAAKLSPSRWKAIRPVLVDGVRFVSDGESITQKRLAAELKKANRMSDSKAQAGAKGAAKRWQNHGTAMAQPLAEPSQTQRQTDAPTPLHPPTDASHPPEESLAPTALVDEPSSRRPPACPTEVLIGLYHEHLPMLPRVEVVGESRKRAISARWREVVSDVDIRRSEDVRAAAIDWFRWFFGHCASSRFLTGRAKDWRADIDFLMTPSKFARVVEGAYHKEAA